MSNQVQAMTIAMFGAAAGGYTAELEASVEASGVAAVANSIMGLQQPLLGIDLSDNSVWTDFVLSNLGINDTNAAYGTAAAYFVARFVAGATRGDIIAEAVAYLTGTVSAEFTAVAAAFVAQVETAEEWSVGDGAESLGITDLRAAIDNPAVPGVFNLTSALAALAAAEEAEAAALVAVGLEDAGNEIDANNELIEDEEAADFAAADNYFGEDAEDELAAAVAEAGQAEDTHQLAISELAIDRLIKNDATVAAELAAATAAVADDEDAAALLADYEDAVADLNTDVTANGTTLALATALSDAIAAYLVQNSDINDADADDNTTALQEVVDAYQVVLAAVEAEAGVDAALALWATEVAEATIAIDATEEDTTGILVDGVRADAVIAALGEVNDRLVLEAAVADTLEAFGTNPLGEDQLDAQAAQDDRDEAIALVASTAADLAAAEAYAAELGELVGAYDSAVLATEAAAEAIALADYVLQPGTASSVDKDVYTADSGPGTVATFAAGDVISVAGFTFNSGDVETDGNNSVLEFFLTETETGLDVTFETAVFGSNAADPEVVTITLTGVTLEEVSVGANYITGL